MELTKYERKINIILDNAQIHKSEGNKNNSRDFKH